MKARRVLILLGKELSTNSRGFMLIFAVVAPIVISFVVSVLFGRLFAGLPRLGIADAGESRMVTLAEAVDALVVSRYESAEALREAVGDGRVDAGIILPTGFDASLASGGETEFIIYVWGESLLNDRAVLATALFHMLREISGNNESPVEVVTTTLGDGESVPWDQRLLPFVVLMAIILGGTMIPATSLVTEKSKKTLGALTISPATLGEVLTAKGLFGVIVSAVMGMLILIINRAFGSHPLLLTGVLVLAGTFSAAFGVLLGLLVKDINTLFAVIKGLGILLYAPAIVYLFPRIPEWIGRIFPTYYLLSPVVELSQRGSTWIDIAPEVGILALLIAGLVAVNAALGRRLAQTEF